MTLDAIETAIRGGVEHALRKRAAVQRQRAADGTTPAGVHAPDLMLRSPEAALAQHLAADLESIAAEIEADACH
jgi:hypothetical protein